jgi:hypothetical protein
VCVGIEELRARAAKAAVVAARIVGVVGEVVFIGVPYITGHPPYRWRVHVRIRMAGLPRDLAFDCTTVADKDGAFVARRVPL